MKLFRTTRTYPITITHRFSDADGESAATVTGVVATAVSAATGLEVDLPDVDGPADDVYTVRVPGQSALDQLVVSWSATLDGSLVVDTDLVEVAGGTYFDLADLRAGDRDLADVTAYSTERLRTARVEVEEECEAICGRAFVRRYRKVVVSGRDELGLILPDADVRAIRSAGIIATPGTAPVLLSDAELAALVVNGDSRTLTRPAGSVWPGGTGNVVLGYEYGLDRPPTDLRRAAMTRMRTWVSTPNRGIPPRAESWTDSAGQTYRLTLPEAYATGEPDVDAAYARYSLRPSSSGGGEGGTSGNPAPASRLLQYRPSRHHMFPREY